MTDTPTDGASSRTCATLSEDTIALLEVAGARVNHEHELISHRMTWLMALNGFLIAGFALLLANTDKLDQDTEIAFAVVGVSALGALANLSCFFSNFWATASIHDVQDILSRIVNDKRYVDRLRLYGFDPRRRAGVPTGRRFWTPPSKVLHPWHVMPLAFCASFTLLPVLAAKSSIPHVEMDGVVPFIALIVDVAFGVWALADVPHHRRSGQATSSSRTDPSPSEAQARS
jgi:hypothetical protein